MSGSRAGTQDLGFPQGFGLTYERPATDRLGERLADGLTDSLYVLGPRSDLAGNHLIGHPCALHEHLERAALKGAHAGEADEKIIAPIVGNDVAFTRLVAEPLDRSSVRSYEHPSKSSFQRLSHLA